MQFIVSNWYQIGALQRVDWQFLLVVALILAALGYLFVQVGKKKTKSCGGSCSCISKDKDGSERGLKGEG